MAPRTSYCPPTRSPAFRVGMNEYFRPHFEQMRLLSGTLGSARTDFSGSVEGSSGTEMRPAPRFLRELREEDREDERRDPMAPRATGDDPVAVETAALPLVTGFGAASPQTLQYPSSMTPLQPG